MEKIGKNPMRKKGEILVKILFIGEQLGPTHLEIFCFEYSGRFFLPLSNCFALLRLCTYPQP